MQIKKFITTVALLSVLSGSAVLAAQTKTKIEDLSAKFQDWLKLVSYIILPAERDVFLTLTSDRERDIFIEAFWKQRDPTPGTPENEFQQEHIRRFQYANSMFKRGTPREGWLTDQGRVYILLGKPSSIEYFDGIAGIHPSQVWYYYGDASKGLPPFFGLVFCQRGSGEYKLYNPSSDGPGSLLIDTKGVDLTNFEQVYNKIKELAPTLANMSVSLIPGQFPSGFSPSPQNTLILSSILESPKKAVSSSYATHFLRYKGIVSTEYLTNFVECSASVGLITDSELDIDFIHFAISPQRISIEYYQPKDQYYAGFQLSVSLRQNDKVIYQSTKDYPFYFPPEKEEAIRTNGIALLDLIPAPEGKFLLTLLLQNSSGKEFSLFETEVEVPAPETKPRLSKPLFGYKIEEDEMSGTAAFKSNKVRFYPELKNTVGRKEQIAFLVNVSNITGTLLQTGSLEAAVESASRKEKPLTTLTFPLTRFPQLRNICLAGSFPAESFPPDYYDLSLRLKDGQGKILDETSIPFAVAGDSYVPHAVTISRSLPAASSFLYYYGLAYGYEQIGNNQKALAFYEKAHRLQPDYSPGTVDYASFLIRTKNFDGAVALVETLRNNDRFRFEYHLLRGEALLGKREFAAARDSLVEANRIYNSDVRVLNALGQSYLGTGQKKESLAAFKASLSLNPSQPAIASLVSALEKEIK